MKYRVYAYDIRMEQWTRVENKFTGDKTWTTQQGAQIVADRTKLLPNMVIVLIVQGKLRHCDTRLSRQ